MLSRREAFALAGVLAAMTRDYTPGGPGTGRQPAPMNAPQAPELSIGVQPGTPNIIRAFQVIVSGGANSGIFVYSPTVGAGNLVASLTAQSGTDPFLNFYPAGLNVGKIASGHTHIDIDGSIDINNSASQLIATLRPQDQALLFYTPGGGANTLQSSIASASGTDQFGNAYLQGVTVYRNPGLPSAAWTAAVYDGGGVNYHQAASEAGPWSSNDTNGNPMPSFTIVGAGAGGGIPEIAWNGGYITLTPIDTVAPLVAADPASVATTTAETWHTLGGGLGIANLSRTHGRYRMTPEGEVEIDVLLTATGAGGPASGTFANNLAAQYQPALQRSYPLMGPLAAGPGRVLVSTAGAVQVSLPAFANGNIFGGTIIMPLD